MNRSRRRFAAVVAITLLGCRGEPSSALAEFLEARRLASDVRAQFNKASDASNRAVMADTEEASVAFAREAETLKGLVRMDVGALEPRLRNLGRGGELASLEEFGKELADYEKVDKEILALAVENTNLKAQLFSFGPARQAADAVRDSLATAAASANAKDRCRVDALVAKVMAAVREIQILQAPHIAELDDAVMSRFEKEMAALQVTAHDAALALAALVDSKAKPSVTAASIALDDFARVSKEIVRLSRRNSNLRSVDLSLRRKPALTVACDKSLGLLQDALARDPFPATK